MQSIYLQKNRTVVDVSSSQFSRPREVHSDEFSETWWVVVSHGLRVTESFEYRVRLHNLLFQSSLTDKNVFVS